MLITYEAEKGYDTELKERGGLSSAKTAPSFCRTMVSMPKILILDEATSALILTQSY